MDTMQLNIGGHSDSVSPSFKLFPMMQFPQMH